MIADERTVARLRHEVGTVDVRTRSGQVDRVLRQVHHRRREQRQHRMQMMAAVAVVLIAVAGAFVVMWRTPDQPDQVNPTQAVLDWPLRGELAGDRDLLARAEAVWRGGKDAPGGQVRAVYAGQSPNRAASLVVVVLTASGPDGRDRVAFVTSPVNVSGQPDAGRLLLRAVTTVDPGQRAVGFLAAKAARSDEPIRGGGGVAFALGAPGVTDIALRSSVLDDVGTEPPSVRAGTVWKVFETGIGAWNTGIEVSFPGSAKPMTARLTSALDDAAAEPVTLTTTAGGLCAIGARPGDLIVTPAGVVGVVTRADGLVDTRLTTLASAGDIRIAISNIPGELVEGTDGAVLFRAADTTELRPTNRVVLVGRGRAELVINIGRLARTGSGWLVERLADPDSAVAVMRVGNR